MTTSRFGKAWTEGTIVEPEKTTVRDFMSGNVLKIYAHSNVSNAIKLMADNNVGSVVVIDSEGPRGVFTERDLLSKVLAKGRDRDFSLMMELLSPLFVTVDPTTTLAEAAKTMANSNSRLMVFEGGDLEGIVTATDIVGCIQHTGKPLNLAKVISRRVGMEPPETPLGTIVRLMDERHLGSVLVGEEEARPYGIFTERDLLLKVLVKKISLDAAVGEFASVPLVTAPFTIDGVEAAKIMSSKGIKRLPLATGDMDVIGMVTAKDLVSAFAMTV